jgi:hypothetical protein
MRNKVVGSIMLCLICGASVCSGFVESNATSSVQDIYQLEELFFEHQYRFLPIGPPSEEVLLQPYGPVLPVDWKRFPKAFTKQMYAELDAVGFPLYRVAIYEDPISRDTVFLNSYGFEVYRLAPEQDYNPYAWQVAQFNLDTAYFFDDFYRWIYDPAHVAATFTLLPEGFYDEYLAVQQEQVLLSASLAPISMMMSLPAVVTNIQLAINVSTNNTIEVEVGWPTNFIDRLELYSNTNLMTYTWQLACSNIITTNSSSYVWSTSLYPAIDSLFVLAANADLDSDSDDLVDGREKYFYDTDPQDADSDDDNINDGNEIALGLDPNIPNTELLITTVSVPSGYVSDTYGPVQLQAVNGEQPYSWWVYSSFTGLVESSESNSFQLSGNGKLWREDDETWLLPLPFEFPFYGSTYSSCWVDSNGRISFDDPWSDTSGSVAEMQNYSIIAVLWDDLDMQAGDIYVEQGTDSVTICWDGVYYSLSSNVSCSVTLDSQGSITMKYGNGNALGGFIGVSAGNGSDYLISAYSESGSMDNADDIVFTPADGPGAMPAGLNFSTNGVISGTPPAAWSGTVRFAVSDSLGEQAFREMELNIVPPFFFSSINPNTAEVALHDNSNQLFSVSIDNPGSRSISQVWTWDGSPLSSNTLSQSIASNLTSVGSHALTVVADDGQYAVSNTWNILVYSDTSDFDGDTMPDAYELQYGLDPGYAGDAQQDMDGDRIPNVFEFGHQTNPTNPASLPQPTVIVSTNGHGGTFSTLASGIAAAIQSNSYPIVLLEEGTHKGAGNRNILISNDILIYGTNSTTVIDCENADRAFRINSGSPVLSGLVIRNGQYSFDGGAIYVSGSSAYPYICNSVFINNVSGDDGGVIDSDNANFRMEHCTLVGNHAFGDYGAAYGRVKMNGCLVWGNESDGEYAQLDDLIEVRNSCVQDGHKGDVAINVIVVDPQLDPGSWRLSSSDSPCVDYADAFMLAMPDIDGELRIGKIDIGADEFVDSDGDNISDWHELNGDPPTNPNSSDTDGDQLSDWDEIHLYGTDPTDADSDDDGLQDGDEIAWGTDPHAQDTDGDGLSDYYEVSMHSTYGTDPVLADTDADGLTDYDEIYVFLSQPSVHDSMVDTDGDGIVDVLENLMGTSPSSASDPQQGAETITVIYPYAGQILN